MLGTKLTGSCVAAAFAVMAILSGPAYAQNFPNAPVKFLVPVPAGGVTDTMARIVGTRLSEMWGQPVIVENRPGGNYAVATQAVARSPADGYTLLVAPDSTFTANPSLIANINYNIKEFTPISVLSRGTPMLVVNAALPVKDVKELVALAKAKPGTLNYGSYGVGTYAHLSMEDFKQRSGTDILHIPYRGAAPATNDLLSGQINMVLLNLSSIAEHEKSGKVKILASAGDKRAEARPDLPTVAESGVPGFATTVWFGLLGPANMPADVVAKIHADVAKVLAMPQTKEFFEKNSFERMDLTPAQFGELIERDSKHWAALIKSVGAKID